MSVNKLTESCFVCYLDDDDNPNWWVCYKEGKNSKWVIGVTDNRRLSLTACPGVACFRACIFPETVITDNQEEATLTFANGEYFLQIENKQPKKLVVNAKHPMTFSAVK